MSRENAVNAITRFKVQKSNKSETKLDQVVSEEPLEIRIDDGNGDKRLAITMRTPGNDLELAAGFLWSEGLLRNREDLISITSCKDQNLSERERENIVVCHVQKDAPVNSRELERRFTISSACGVCGTDQIEDLKIRGCNQLENPGIGIEDLVKLPEIIISLKRKPKEGKSCFTVTGIKDFLEDHYVDDDVPAGLPIVNPL